MRATGADLPSGLVTFLFTDVESSTVLQGRLGDAYGALVARHDELLGGIVREHGGAVVKTLGDGIFAAFPEVAAGVKATAAIQSAVAAEPWGVELRVRAGLHAGPAQPRDGDYAALAATVAARVSAAAHGGQVLATEDVASAVPDARWHDLGAYTLRGLEAPVRLLQLDDEAGAFPAPRALPVARHNVPAIRTTFVGRDAELDELARLAAEHRVVSMLGPGGAGKTRLSFELARRVSGEHRDGAWVVLLADLPRDSEVADRVAATLGVRAFGGGTAEEALAGWCASHEALVVLDNCEHVTEPVARLVDGLLGETSRVRFLVTSREPLRVAGEVEWRLPLLPSEGAPGEAVLLFLDRARLARPGLDLGGETDRVAELCRKVDGLPLAVELAASRLRHSSLDALLEDVEDRVALLRGRTVGVDERHHSLQALLDWGHDLLAEDERRALRRCAVFHSAFPVAAAAAVLERSPREARDLLERLADRSLLQVTPDREPRFLMLMTIADYAVERLRESGEAAATAELHAAWVSGELTAGGDRRLLERDDSDTAFARFAALHDDALAALAHLADTRNDAGLAALANAMFEYWLVVGAFATALPWLRLAGERGDARALGRAGSFFEMVTPGAREALELLRRACAMARADGDEEVLAECLVRLGVRLVTMTDGREGIAECTEALRLPGAVVRDRGGALLGLGIAASEAGDDDLALARYEEALALRAAPAQIAIAESNIADILIDRGRLAEATARLTAALPLVEGREPGSVSRLCKMLHRIAVIEGDTALAVYWLDRGIRTADAVGGADSEFARTLRDLRARLVVGRSA